jgi:hypothetical protein
VAEASSRPPLAATASNGDVGSSKTHVDVAKSPAKTAVKGLPNEGEKGGNGSKVGGVRKKPGDATGDDDERSPPKKQRGSSRA